MKVFIGKYRRHHSAYTVAESVSRLFGFSEERKDKFEDWFVESRAGVFIDKLLSPLQKREPQKIKVRIDKWDTWSADYTLAHIILPVLVQLKDGKMGAPYVDNEDVPMDLWDTRSEEERKCGDVDKHHFDRWDYVLNEMIFAFDDKLYGDERDEYSFYSGNIDWEGYREKEERKKKGFLLFGKYYENLWT